MYAIIKSGGKQYKVAAGSKLRVDKLDVVAGESINITDVLMVVDGDKVKLGTPLVKDANVTAKVEGHIRGPKIRIIKFRRRKHYRRQAGHRQTYTRLAITDIKV